MRKESTPITRKRSLRAATIKLAYERPELREHLLPLLKRALDPGTNSLLKNFHRQTGMAPDESNLLRNFAQRRRGTITVTEYGRPIFTSSERQAIGLLLKKGYLDRVELGEGSWGVSLTTKGRRKAGDLEDLWMEVVL